MTDEQYERMLDTVTTAGEWHSGQWSALYSYASTGKIHGADHQNDLLDDLADIGPVEGFDGECLEHLRRTVECWPHEVV